VREPTSDGPVPFAIVGIGWRAEFFVRVARELPHRFKVCGVVARDPSAGARVTAAWGVPTYRGLDSLLAATQPAFVVLSVPRRVVPDLLAELAERGVAALTETPPAADLEGLLRVWELVARGACIQVAEQYPFQPLHAARLAVVRSGRLGAISQAQVSAAHDYHGTSLIRQLLGVTFEDATISARRFESPIVAGPVRSGPPVEHQLTTSVQVIAQLDFGDRLGIYDFTNDQYHSWIRSPRVLVRGERGEINDLSVRFLADFRSPLVADLRRQDTGHGGNLEGYHHTGVLLGTDWVYRNPFAPGRLADDEIAVATCLDGMAQHVAGGPQVYPFEVAAQDHYLALVIAEAAASGATIQTVAQPWSPQRVRDSQV
jgi:predicted dehydrogenase